jgi:hypothetical protein
MCGTSRLAGTGGARHDATMLTQARVPINRVLAAALACLGAASAVPIPLAQLDFAGLIDVFNINSGDSPDALLVIAAIGGVLTVAVIGAAFLGAGLALSGSRAARPVLLGAALCGLATAFPFWLPAGVIIGAGGLMADRADLGG